MTRLLHTADLHLAPDRPERWEALDAVVALAAEREADGLLVAGDLLDRARGGAALRPRVKRAFERPGCPVFLIPGNHDHTAFESGQDWGARTHLLLSEPAESSDALGDVIVTGIPFPSTPVSLAGILPEVRDVLETGALHVAILHGTLVEAGDPRILSESQEDEGGRYFPCQLEDLEALDAEYVALGHYHQTDLRPLESGYLAYCGSPAPVGSHAWGPRKVVQIDLDEDGVSAESLILPVPYRERHEHWVHPFDEDRSLELLERELVEGGDRLCHLEVTVTGILAELTETALRDRIRELRSRHREAYRDLAISTEGVGLDPELADLFRDFRQRLDGLSDDAEIFTEIAESRSPLAGNLPRDEVRERALRLAARALKRAG